MKSAGAAPPRASNPQQPILHSKRIAIGAMSWHQLSKPALFPLLITVSRQGAVFWNRNSKLFQRAKQLNKASAAGSRTALDVDVFGTDAEHYPASALAAASGSCEGYTSHPAVFL